MATYKVLQDIEAEDKFLGPLTLKQFIFAGIGAVSAYVSFWALAKHVWPIAVVLFPFVAISVLLAFPWGRDQPTEVWLLAKIRFQLKPRRRIWDQSGLKQLVTITAPKHIERHFTNGLSQTEVRSRLQALANTIDSRGWAIKNVNVNLFTQPGYLTQQSDSDRLIDPASMPQEVPAAVVTAQDDILDTQSHVAQQVDMLMTASTQSHRQQAVSRMQQASQPSPAGPPADYWFMHGSPQTAAPGMATFDQSVVLPGASTSTPQPTEEEEALLKKVHLDDSIEKSYAHLKTIQPLSAKRPVVTSAKTPKTPQTSVTAQTDPAILELAKNDDLNVATIARQAKRGRDKQAPGDEVVIPLR